MEEAKIPEKKKMPKVSMEAIVQEE